MLSTQNRIRATKERMRELAEAAGGMDRIEDLYGTLTGAAALCPGDFMLLVSKSETFRKQMLALATFGAAAMLDRRDALMAIPQLATAKGA